jgi:hypothetical protein
MAMSDSTRVATARIGLLDAEHIGGLPLPVAAAGMYAVSVLLVAAPLALYSVAIAELTLV